MRHSKHFRMDSVSFDQSIEGQRTKMHITLYQNRVLLIISQTESFGSVMLAR